MLKISKFFEGYSMALLLNNYVFKGHKTLLGARYVTYAELELPNYYELFNKSKTFDWGFLGSPALQLAFAMLYQVTKDQELSQNLAQKFSQTVIKYFGKDWIYSAKELLKWVEQQNNQTQRLQVANNTKKAQTKHSNRTTKRGPSKDNIVKQYCKMLGITQKELAKILEIPEGTVSSWAVKNEIPRLGKKAIEFYIENQKKEQIIQSYKSFVDMLQKESA